MEANEVEANFIRNFQNLIDRINSSQYNNMRVFTSDCPCPDLDVNENI